MKLLAMTCCCVDVYPHSGEIHPGGNALNIAADWALQGQRILSHPKCRDREAAVHLLGAIGPDEYGAHVQASVASLPINFDNLHVIDDATANHRICINASGDRYFEPDAWTGGAYEHYRLSESDLMAIAAMDVVVITFNDPNLESVINVRKRHPDSFRLAVDFQDTRDFAAWIPHLPFIDVFFISGDGAVLSQLNAWSKEYDSVFIATLGAGGSMLFHKGKAHHADALPVDAVVDTTGCGDAWLAGFLLASQSGLGFDDSMQAGSEAAAAVIGHSGGFRTD